MTATLWYTQDVEATPIKRKRGRPRKQENTMTPTQAPETKVTERTFSPITRTVFDLAAFDDVKLEKDFNPPTKPASLEEALGLVANDSQKLLDLIYEGLVAEARTSQYEDIAGFATLAEDGSRGAAYAGKYADEKKGKAINLAVLALAKATSGGGWDSFTADQKRKQKDTAIEFMRSNPAMLASIQG